MVILILKMLYISVIVMVVLSNYFFKFHTHSSVCDEQVYSIEVHYQQCMIFLCFYFVWLSEKTFQNGAVWLDLETWV